MIASTRAEGPEVVTAWKRPRSVEDACSMLVAGGASLRAAAGCSAVPPSELVNDPTVAGVVDLLALDELSGIEETAAGLRIGATTTIAEIAGADAVRELAPMLADLAAGVGDEVLREAATLGGNVAARVPRQYEFAIAMVALDASLELASTEGGRTIPATELCDRSFALDAGELIVGFDVPRESGTSTYRKLTTNLDSYGIAALAIVVSAADRPPQVIAGLGESIPQALPAAAEALAGGEGFDPGAVAEEATEDLIALDDALASASYRRRVLRLSLARELARISAEPASQTGPASQARPPAQNTTAPSRAMPSRAEMTPGGLDLVEFELNGEPASVEGGRTMSLLRALRERFGLTGAKTVCEQGACGGCTVLVDGRPTRSCLFPVARLGGASVQTVEGLARDGALTPLQDAFARHGALQCGYCTSGIVMRMEALLREEPDPSAERVREALASNLCRCTGYEKIVEAVLAAAAPTQVRDSDQPSARDADGHSGMGARVPQRRGWTVVTGEERFASDMTLPRMLHAKILRSPHAHAAIRRIDVAGAREVPGVVDVITFEDVPTDLYNSAFRNPNDAQTLRPDERVLNDKARYDGDRLAAVVAESAEAAGAGVQRIEVDYEPLPAYVDPVEALGPGAIEIHDGTNNEAAAPRTIEFGDFDQAWEDADVRVEGTFRTQGAQHANLEPKTVIADPTPDGRLTLYATTQVPFHIRTIIPQALGIPESDVRVVAVGMGGGQGERSDPSDEYVAALLARRLGRPVKLVNTREEQFTSTRVRHPALIESGVAADRNGTLVARRTRSVIATGGYATMGHRVNLSLGVRSAALYRVPNLRYEGRVAYTNTPVGGGMRGFGSPQAAFAIESQLDELSERLEIDPIDLRARNVMRAGDPYLDLGSEWTVRSSAAVEGLELVRERTDWDRKRRELGGRGDDGRLRGIGVALGSHISTVMPYYRDHGDAEIQLGEDGTFVVYVGVPETGTGSTTIYAQLAAEELGIESGRVRVETGDTDLAPYDQGAHSSRTTYVAGGAVREAAVAIKREILRAASEMLEAQPGDLEFDSGNVLVKGAPGTAVSVEKLAHWLRYESDHPRRLSAEGSRLPSNVAPPFAISVAEVAIEPDTGRLRVEGVTLAIDCGAPVNPMFVEGQLHGAIHMGVGAAISEEMSFDDEGRLRTRSFADYQLLRAAEMPRIETIILDSNEPTGPFGAKGLGEASVVPVAPSVSNAVAHAIGARPRELPLTPERVLDLIES